MAQKLTQLAQTTVTTAGTRVQLNSGTSFRTASVQVQAAYTNSGYVYVGDSSVSSTVGIALAPGDCVCIEGEEGQYVDIADIYVDASVNSSKVNVSYLKQRN